MTFLTNIVLPLLMGVAGGAFAIVFGVSGWFGRVIADKMSQRLRARFDSELRRLQERIDRAVVVHRAHFETEFAALQDIWKKVAQVRAVVIGLVHPGPDPREQEKGRQAFNDAKNDLIRAIDQQSPFYTKDLYAELDAFRMLAIMALSDHAGEHIGRRSVERDYGDEIRKKTELISDRIRNRIESLTVIP